MQLLPLPHMQTGTMRAEHLAHPLTRSTQAQRQGQAWMCMEMHASRGSRLRPLRHATGIHQRWALREVPLSTALRDESCKNRRVLPWCFEISACLIYFRSRHQWRRSPVPTQLVNACNTSYISSLSSRHLAMIISHLIHPLGPLFPADRYS